MPARLTVLAPLKRWTCSIRGLFFAVCIYIIGSVFFSEEDDREHFPVTPVQVTTSIAVPAAADITDANVQKKKSKRSENEKYYGKGYFTWQIGYNRFGAAWKGDIIRALFPRGKKPLPVAPSSSKSKSKLMYNMSVIEFGCSGGYIIGGLPVTSKSGVEINPASLQHANENQLNLSTYLRIADIPPGTTYDMVYSTSVIEHVDCPLCEVRQLKDLISPTTGRLVIGIKNDGAAPKQHWTRDDVNHHIYTWNELLLGNLMTSAGLYVCDVKGSFNAWWSTNVVDYERNKTKYCLKAVQHGEKTHTYNVWGVAVHPENKKACGEIREQLLAITDPHCSYLV